MPSQGLSAVIDKEFFFLRENCEAHDASNGLRIQDVFAEADAELEEATGN